MDVLTNTKNLIIKRRNVVQLINLEDILFIEKFGNTCMINTLNSEIELRYNLSSIESILPSYFIRSNRSYIINTKLITKIKYEKKSNFYKVFFQDNFDNKDTYAILNRGKIKNVITMIEAL